MAQLVEQLIRNEQVVGSSPTISSKGNPRLNVLFEWGLLCCCFYFMKLNIYLKTSINRFFLYLSLNVATRRTYVSRCIINLYIFVAYNKLLVFCIIFLLNNVLLSLKCFINVNIKLILTHKFYCEFKKRNMEGKDMFKLKTKSRLNQTLSAHWLQL